jgi:hypothetical protein
VLDFKRVCSGLDFQKTVGVGSQKEKRKQAPALSNVVIYEIQYTINYEFVKGDFGRNAMNARGRAEGHRKGVKHLS